MNVNVHKRSHKSHAFVYTVSFSLLKGKSTYLLRFLLTYVMEESPSWEADWFSASQEIPRILWNPSVRYRTHKCPPLSVYWASSIQSTSPHLTSWRSKSVLSSHLRLGLSSGLFPSGFPTKTLYAPLFSPIDSTCPAHLILPDLLTWTTLGEEYRSLSSSLCSFFPLPCYLVLLRPIYSPQSPILTHP